MVDVFHSASLHLILNEVVHPTLSCFAGGGREAFVSFSAWRGTCMSVLSSSNPNVSPGIRISGGRLVPHVQRPTPAAWSGLATFYWF